MNTNVVIKVNREHLDYAKSYSQPPGQFPPLVYALHSAFPNSCMGLTDKGVKIDGKALTWPDNVLEYISTFNKDSRDYDSIAEFEFVLDITYEELGYQLMDNCYQKPGGLKRGVFVMSPVGLDFF